MRDCSWFTAGSVAAPATLWVGGRNCADGQKRFKSVRADRGNLLYRQWQSSDVATTPSTGTWFQLVQNGTVGINDGPNGLQKLDTVVQVAQQHGLYVTLTLTNDWCPSASNSTGSSLQSRGGATEITFPRNYLSNDYGNSVLNAFQNFTSQVVPRYVNSPAIFSWELANDSRCNSTLPTSSSCTTETITEWHATMAQYIRSIDPNHLISSGHLRPKAPRSVTFLLPLSNFSVSVLKLGVLNRLAAKLAGKLKEDGIRVRGRWAATGTRRQQSPELFPDQNSYAPNDPSLSPYENSVNSGIDWIKNQAQSAAAYVDSSQFQSNARMRSPRVGKLLVMTALGSATQDNAADSALPNTTTAPYTSDSCTCLFYVVEYISLNLAGIIQYQVISPGVTGITLSPRQVSSNNDTTGKSPNEGYARLAVVPSSMEIVHSPISIKPNLDSSFTDDDQFLARLSNEISTDYGGKKPCEPGSDGKIRSQLQSEVVELYLSREDSNTTKDGQLL
ncbi:glycoside hydrolase superfamily [Pisolithus thermaeus]|nr:glycoside hydrolase superfamily [Pisolithus thermaeus]